MQQRNSCYIVSYYSKHVLDDAKCTANGGITPLRLIPVKYWLVFQSERTQKAAVHAYCATWISAIIRVSSALTG
jgi:hypothetical protein